MAIDKKKKEAVKTVVKITDAEEKKKALDTAIAYIEKQFGKGAVMKLGDNAAMRYTDLSHQVRQRSHFMLSQKHRKWAER